MTYELILRVEVPKDDRCCHCSRCNPCVKVMLEAFAKHATQGLLDELDPLGIFPEKPTVTIHQKETHYFNPK